MVLLHISAWARIIYFFTISDLQSLRAKFKGAPKLDQNISRVFQRIRLKTVPVRVGNTTYISTINRRRPPEREATIRDLIQSWSLSVREFLELHWLFESGCTFPEETLPGREVGSAEERMLEDSFDSPEGLDHVRAVVIQVPELSIVTLVGPPEGILFQDL